MDILKELEKVGEDLLIAELPNLEKALEQILKNAGTDPSVALVLKREMAATRTRVSGKLDSLHLRVQQTIPEAPAGGLPATPGPCESCGHVPGTPVVDNTPKTTSTVAVAGAISADAAGKAESAGNSSEHAGTDEAAETKEPAKAADEADEPAKGKNGNGGSKKK